jgi:excisionase family DNA binding protein
MTTNDFAHEVGVDQKTVRGWCDNGKIGFVRLGQYRMIPRSELDRLQLAADENRRQLAAAAAARKATTSDLQRAADENRLQLAADENRARLAAAAEARLAQPAKSTP